MLVVFFPCVKEETTLDTRTPRRIFGVSWDVKPFIIVTAANDSLERS